MSEPIDRVPVYTAATPQVPDPAELRARIPGWGVDLDPRDRPACPQELRAHTGAHWDYPDEQPEHTPRERSMEHEQLPPVFGPSVPLRGLSGMVRRNAYRNFSEAKAAHWLLLLAGDRIDAAESHLRALLSGRPDNPIAESGAIAQWGRRRRGNTSRRIDPKHTWLDPIVVLGPWVGAAVGVGLVARGLARRSA